MRIIKLTQGAEAIVDDKDYEWLSKWKWRLFKSRNQRYAIRIDKKKQISMHNVIMNPQKGLEIDHIDNNGLNNQRINLRICTHSQNLMNQNKQRGRKYKGVSKFREGYRSYLKYEGRFISLGVYKTEKEAAKAYDKGAIKYFGDFANTNFKNKNREWMYKKPI